MKLGSERLDKFLSNESGISRKDIKSIIKNGRVSVNNNIITNPEFKIDSEKDSIFLDSNKINHTGKIVIAMNKPNGVICSTEKGSTPTVIDILPPDLKVKGLSPAGRLDKDTTGLVIITNDGDLIHRLISPKKHVSKQYNVTLSRPFESFYITAIKRGITLSNGEKCLPARVEQSGVKNCKLILTEGKYHQVKRMFAALGNNVEKLERVAIGKFILPPNLAPGESMLILHKDLLNLECISELFF